VTVWVDKDALAAVREEAARHAEEETGGMLLGYRSGDDAVVVAVIGPGPAAQRTASTFLPDAGWQQDRLAEVYAASGRTTAYLGDWHTHPGGRPVLSPRDRRTLRRIAGHRPARQPRPLSAVLAPAADGELVFWEHRGRWRSAAAIPWRTSP
jgi:integrative and conjugative element protein (TIGR02256 family)